MKLRLLSIAILTSLLAACGGGGDGGAFSGAIGGGGSGGSGGSGSTCGIDDQKQFVLDAMRDIYFWSDLLPEDVDLATYATPEELLLDLTSVQPLDRFSFIGDAQADSAFFNEGEFVGFGFTTTILDEATDDVRFVRVFADSPAAQGGLERGQQLLAVDGVDVGTILANEGLSEAFGPADEGLVRTLTIGNPDGSTFDAVLTKAVVTIDPVPQIRTFTINGTTYGYIEFATFILTAEPQLEAIFADFGNIGITDLIVDMRYNGGGRVDTAEFFGDLLGGGSVGQVFSETLFNDANIESNRTELFEQRAQALNLSRIVFITTGGSASATELIINSLDPVAEVYLVGSDTFGKPVGQVGLLFCDDTKILRPVAFETVNGLGEGGYFDGLQVDCAAEDDVTTVVGSEQDPSTAAALSWLSGGTCPSATGALKTGQPLAPFRPPAARTSAQQHGYAY